MVSTTSPVAPRPVATRTSQNGTPDRNARDRTLPAIRTVGTADLHWALREGVSDFRAMRGDILFAGLIYPSVALVAAALALGGDMVAIVFPLAAAFSLLGPLIAIGFYEMARRREQGMEAGWRHFLDPLRGSNRGQILGLAAGLLVLALAWMLLASGIYDGTLGRLHPAGASDFFFLLFTTAEGWRMIVMGHIAGLAFALVTLCTMLLSFPMLVDRPVHASDAVETSLRAAFHNPVTTLRWGVYVAGLLAIACIPLFLGLAVALPVLGYASWHLYTRMVER